MNLRWHLVLNPRTGASTHLAQIGRVLSEVIDAEDAIEWQKLLDVFGGDPTGTSPKERTRYRDGSSGYTHASSAKHGTCSTH